MYGESLSSTTAPEEPGFGGVKVVAVGGLGFDGESRRVELWCAMRVGVSGHGLSSPRSIESSREPFRK